MTKDGSTMHLLTPIRRQALSDAVFEQLRDRIVGGELAAGAALPAERALCDALGVNRSSVREAIRRLEQARLVSVRHGGTSRVLDYQRSAGMDLLATLIVTSNGEVDHKVVRSILEMRSAIAADAARLAAGRSAPVVTHELDEIVQRMRKSTPDLTALQSLAMEFWAALVDAADNIAYRLAYNSLRETYNQCRDLLAPTLAEELLDTAAYAAIAESIRAKDAVAAQDRTRQLVRRGEESIKKVLDDVDRAADSE